MMISEKTIELGHNWNAGHCTCVSPPYTMNPYVVSSNSFNPFVTVPAIEAGVEVQARPQLVAPPGFKL